MAYFAEAAGTSQSEHFRQLVHRAPQLEQPGPHWETVFGANLGGWFQRTAENLSRWATGLTTDRL
eukprot:1003429-Rhodomonas_salina.1